MKTIELSKDKYVLYNNLTGCITKDKMHGEFLIFESKEEAERYRTDTIMSCAVLPKHLQEQLLKQINKLK